MGFYFFKFSIETHRLRDKMAKVVKKNTGCKLQVVFEQQQRESLRFISLFGRKMVIHSVRVHILDTRSRSLTITQSPRPLPRAQPTMFHMHSFPPKVFNTKTVEVPLDARLLTPFDCFLLRVCFFSCVMRFRFKHYEFVA